MAFLELKEQIRALQKRITGLSKDSGWVDVPYDSGFGPSTQGQGGISLQVRLRRGDEVYIRGGVSPVAGNSVAAQTYQRVARLPGAAFRPAADGPKIRWSAYGASGRTGGIEIAPNGDILVVFPKASHGGSDTAWESSNWIGVSGSWLTS